MNEKHAGELPSRTGKTTGLQQEKTEGTKDSLLVLDAGEEALAYCNGCRTEFEVTLEPGVLERGTKREVSRLRKEVRFCPFCGAEEVEAA